MRLWLCVHFPLLPLEAIRPCWSEPGSYAVLQQGRVLVASREAHRQGVRCGMRAGGVTAIAPDTQVVERNEDKESMALDAIALALLQYTPEVCYAQDFCILLDVSASLTLFGGPLAICRRVTAGIRALGFSVTLGAAPTATGAWLLSRLPRLLRKKGLILRRRALRMTTLTKLLDRMDYAVMASTLPYAEWLAGIGVNTLADLRKLPRPGLLRRTSQNLIDELDRAYGQAFELFNWIKAPATFSARMETFDRIEHAEALLFGATRLILQLTGWLTALQKATSLLVFFLEHERGWHAIEPTQIEISMAEPAWPAAHINAHLIRLVEEHLSRTALIAPVIAIRLEVKKISAMLPPTLSLFPEPGGSAADWNRLLELLTARMGKESVLAPAGIDDYRPEICNSWVPVSRQSGKNENAYIVERPFWMLAQPIALTMRGERPCYGTPLKLVRGPERVEAGWWDSQMIARDYFVAQDANAGCYWIYLERSSEPRWFLHGLYA